MNIQLCEVRVENFRSIKNATIYLNPLSVMFGMNDSGKSNFLLALGLALGNKSITEEDVFCSQNVNRNFETNVTVDLKFIPVNDAGVQSETFNDLWGRHLGEYVQTDEEEREFFAFRTKFIYDQDKEYYGKERLLITSWQDERIDEGGIIGGRTLFAFECAYLDAHRDISIHIRDKTSMWSRQISKLKVPEEAKEDIENSLTEMNARIMEESPFLQQASKDLVTSTNTGDGRIDIHPIAQTIDELHKGLDIYVTQGISSAISMSNMGSGTRSRAVFASLRTIVNEKINGATETPLFYITAFEEPEAHVHPQAQRKLISDFSDFQGQRVITTHSPYILSSSNVKDLIYAAMHNAETRFISLSRINLEDDEISKIKRMVIDTSGEILFAKAVIFAEGDTERLALPIFFEEYFGRAPFELGISIVGVGGEGNYPPFMKFFESVDAKWFIFSDGEPDVVQKLKSRMKVLKKLDTEPDLNQYDNVIVLDSPYNYEQYLIASGYIDEIVSAIDESGSQPHENELSHFEHFSRSKFSQKNAPKCIECKNVVWERERRNFCCGKGREQAVIDYFMKKGKKVELAIPVAKKILASNADERKYPPKIKILLERINECVEGQR